MYKFRPTHVSSSGTLYQRSNGGYVDIHTWYEGGFNVTESQAVEMEMRPLTAAEREVCEDQAEIDC